MFHPQSRCQKKPREIRAARGSLSSKACRDYSNVQNGSLVCPSVHPPVSEMHLRLGWWLRVDPVRAVTPIKIIKVQMNKLPWYAKSTKKQLVKYCTFAHTKHDHFSGFNLVPPIQNGLLWPFQGGGAGCLAGSQLRSEESWVPWWGVTDIY